MQKEMPVTAGPRGNDDGAIGNDCAIRVSVGGLCFHLRYCFDRQRQGAGPYEPSSHEYAFLSIAAMSGGLFGDLAYLCAKDWRVVNGKGSRQRLSHLSERG